LELVEQFEREEGLGRELKLVEQFIKHFVKLLLVVIVVKRRDWVIVVDYLESLTGSDQFVVGYSKLVDFMPQHFQE
jgi:hypothetical protein